MSPEAHIGLVPITGTVSSLGQFFEVQVGAAVVRIVVGTEAAPSGSASIAGTVAYSGSFLGRRGGSRRTH